MCHVRLISGEILSCQILFQLIWEKRRSKMGLYQSFWCSTVPSSQPSYGTHTYTHTQSVSQSNRPKRTMVLGSFLRDPCFYTQTLMEVILAWQGPVAFIAYHLKFIDGRVWNMQTRGASFSHQERLMNFEYFSYGNVEIHLMSHFPSMFFVCLEHKL